MLAVMPLQLSAQAKKSDTSNKVNIEIVQAKYLYYVQTDSGGIDKLIENVILKQAENTMYCDSAYFNLSKNIVEAFGNVRIVQPGSEAQSDYMRYVGNQKTAYMKGNVKLTDGKSNLWSEDLTYNTSTKIGVYTQGGTLQDSNTTVSSNAGTYNMKDKNSRFSGEVIVTNPEYEIKSDDLGYNSDTKVMTFFAKSVVTSDSTVLHTSCGTYDSKDQIAHLPCRSLVVNKDQTIEADTLHHNRKTGWGKALGHVVSIDTERHSTLYCGRTDFNEKQKKLWATIRPVLKQLNDKDSLFIRADSFYSFPVVKKKDTLLATKAKNVKDKRKLKVKDVVPADTIAADSNAPRKFIGYHHVLIFSDSMQGKCDSISYSDEDSVMRMMYDPYVWSRKSQINGDTILLYMDSSKIRKMYIPNNAFSVSQSGPEKAKLFDQVQGKTITAFFKDGNIDYMLVKPDAQTIWYGKDDNGAYLGVNEANGTRMKVYFKNDEIHKVLFEEDVKSKMTPLDKADLPNMKLTRFKWIIDKRPKSKEELFR
jgi:lipopolysaccharide export system protein LptA